MKGNASDAKPQKQPEKPPVESTGPKPAPKPAAKEARRKRKVRRAKARRPRAARKRRARRGRYSDAERSRIIAVARREGLTATQVEERFGVKRVTYYSWTKKVRGAGRRVPRRVRAGGGADVAGEIRRQIRARITQILGSVLRSEVASALSTHGGGGRRRK